MTLWEWLIAVTVATVVAVSSFLPSPLNTKPEQLSSSTTSSSIASTTTVVVTTSTPSTIVTSTRDNAFWRRLANCEQRNGPNYFQFMGGTAEKVGFFIGATYEQQRSMAIEWARRIHPREGTKAGWPVCWWVALRG